MLSKADFRQELPSIRTLQQTYEVADGTVQKALRILKDEGLAHTVQGRGVFVGVAQAEDGSLCGRDPVGVLVLQP
jgi:DNA-binding GntR family transcriptional regulator